MFMNKLRNIFGQRVGQMVVMCIAAVAMTMSTTRSEAQSAETEMEASAERARKVLSEMSSKVKSAQTVSVGFTATLENKRTGEKTENKGTLAMKGEKYVLDVNDMVTYHNGKEVAVWQKRHNEVDISDPDPEEEGDLSPKKIFSAYNEGYRLRMLGDVKVGTSVCCEVDLYPTDKTSIVRIRLTIDKSTKQLKRFWQQNKSGETLTVTIDRYETNKAMVDDMFTFDASKHPDIEVVDLR